MLTYNLSGEVKEYRMTWLGDLDLQLPNNAAQLQQGNDVVWDGQNTWQLMMVIK